MTDKAFRELHLRERLNLSRLALRHPRGTVVLWTGLSIAGLIAFVALRHSLFPDIQFPVVVARYDFAQGTAPEHEASVIGPAERALRGTRDLKSVRASITDTSAVLVAEFEAGVPLDEAGHRLRERLVSAVSGQVPGIRTIDINESPVVTLVLVGKHRTPAQLMGTAMGKYLPALREVPGVLRVVPLGADPDTLAALAGTAPDSQLARSVVRLDGAPGVALEVVKEAGSNTLELLGRIDSVVRRLQWDDPDLHLVPAVTQGDFIRESANATLEALALAMVLSVVIIMPFLASWRATAISALAIPVSLFGAFIVMWLAGFELESITLLALALVIGIIVDDAIVDVENIQRHVERGEPPVRAAWKATDEIGLTVTAATLAIVAVFLPVGLMQGNVGRFFKPFGLTISAAVIFSLLVARTLSPVLAGNCLREVARGKGRGASGAWKRFSRSYQAALGWSLDHPGAVMAMLVAAVVGAGLLVPFIPKGFIPRFERHEFIIALEGLPGASLAQADSAAEAVERAVRRDASVRQVFTTVGDAAGRPDVALLHVRLADGASTDEVKARLRPAVAEAAGSWHASLQDLPLLAVIAEKPFQVGVVGEDRAVLSRAAGQLADSLQGLRRVTDVVLAGGSTGGGRLERIDGRPAVLISGNLVEGTTIGAATRELDRLGGLLPPGVALSLGGESAKAAEVFGAFAFTLGIAALCVVAVLWFLFRSWQDPLAIALALPLAAVGALLALFVTRSDFGIISLLGLVFLFGLAGKNAILLLDRTNQLRAAGVTRKAAQLTAAAERLRPIIMTTAATILGMLPIALGLGAGAELRAPLAIAIIGGLLTSSILSLLVVPAAYQVLDRVHPRFVEAGRVIAGGTGPGASSSLDSPELYDDAP